MDARPIVAGWVYIADLVRHGGIGHSIMLAWMELYSTNDIAVEPSSCEERVMYCR